MRRTVRVLGAALCCAVLGSCGGAIPLATQLSLGATGLGLGVSAIHDCKADGGAPGCLNPFTPSKPAP